ncbi:7820_t:CDS:2, partial [Ambispora gerdemannii]
LKVTAACLNCRKKKVKCSGPAVCDRCSRFNLSCQFDARPQKRGPQRGNVDVIKVKESRVEDLFDTIPGDLNFKEKERLKNQALSIDGISPDEFEQVSKISMKFHNPEAIPRLTILQNCIVTTNSCAKCSSKSEPYLPENQIYQHSEFCQQLPSLSPTNHQSLQSLEPISITSIPIEPMNAPTNSVNNDSYLAPILLLPDEMLRGSVPVPNFCISDEESISYDHVNNYNNYDYNDYNDYLAENKYRKARELKGDVEINIRLMNLNNRRQGILVAILYTSGNHNGGRITK